ncbi:hypothetical protein SODALDRAFT_326141 [Sodiomyces alkalinus F11]|uniref:NAD(P)-binding domain-containing protein n=1 Tax=Sodiomyces alkalinus (strain CBS 110278 / VKM F-3762 / F11) TaxID=1314773 RepID=A0A3N2Q5C6_SODAK|nr:hypothetical protein SODALDRAFT_326141 [Sodiomyces alkalinus F11]ROT41971.1 hypothetical protein SODALDRAFT_326141 [Sodiomyces alkalinus F11]
MHLILTGATGVVGSSVLDAMLKNKEVTTISILSRRPVPLADQAQDPRVHVIIHEDFAQYPPEVLEQLKGAQGVVWALGVRPMTVGKEEYLRITKDYPTAAASAFSSSLATETTEKDPFRFVFVSGAFATQKPGPFHPLYARTKGQTEARLSEIAAQSQGRFVVDSLRASTVDPTGHEAVLKVVPRDGVLKRLGFAANRVLVPAMYAPSEPLGRFLTGLALGKYEAQLAEGGTEGAKVGRLPRVRLLENPMFRRLIGLP